MPKACGYCRVSTDKQVRSGLSLEHQYERCADAIAILCRQRALQPGDIFTEPDGVSASKTPFFMRPYGAKLNTILERGDYVVFATYDRSFRDLQDSEDVRKCWAVRDITMFFADTGMEARGPAGVFIANVLIGIAQWERAIISERTKNGLSRLRKANKSVNGRVPIGYKQVSPGSRIILPDPSVVRILRLIAWYHDYLKWGFDRISDRIEALCAAREGRPTAPDVRRKRGGGDPRYTRYWTHNRCTRGYHNWLEMDKTQIFPRGSEV